MDKIMIKKIRCNALIGTLPQERIAPQMLLIDIELSVDLHKAGRSDELCDTVDYSLIEEKVVEIAQKSSFSLLEALNNAIGNMIMQDKRISSCRVEIFKASGSRCGDGVSVSMDYPEREL